METADVYTVSIDDDYTYETRQTKCLISNVINYSGTIKIKIKANAYGEYGESDWSEVYEYNYIAKTVDYETVQRLMNLSIGRGYNLYEHDYLDLANYASTKSVLDISKLLSIGTFRNPQNSSATGSAINYSSIDEFLTKTAVNIEYASEKSTQLLGSLKKTFSFDANVDYRKYEEKKYIIIYL